MLETEVEKKELIEDYLDRLKWNLLDKVRRMPPNWQGSEIKQLIRDTVENEINSFRHCKKQKRYQDYKNDVIINNL